MGPFLLALAWTVAVELAVLALLVPAAHRRGAVELALAANLITHPFAFALGPELGFLPTECVVVAVETWLVASTVFAPRPRVLLWMLAANTASASGALLLPH
ncbi:MAG: hypothetical protein U1F29_17710 [Planctomycetota bacterium]